MRTRTGTGIAIAIAIALVVVIVIICGRRIICAKFVRLLAHLEALKSE